MQQDPNTPQQEDIPRYAHSEGISGDGPIWDYYNVVDVVVERHEGMLYHTWY